VEKEHKEELRMTLEHILSPRTDVKQTLSPHDQYLGAKARIQALVCAHLDQRDSHARAWWQLNSHLVSVLSLLHAAPLLKICSARVLARTQARRLWTECTHLMPHWVLDKEFQDGKLAHVWPEVHTTTVWTRAPFFSLERPWHEEEEDEEEDEEYEDEDDFDLEEEEEEEEVAEEEEEEEEGFFCGRLSSEDSWAQLRDLMSSDDAISDARSSYVGSEDDFMGDSEVDEEKEGYWEDVSHDDSMPQDMEERFYP
jgi:hypothetical protein